MAAQARRRCPRRAGAIFFGDWHLDKSDVSLPGLVRVESPPRPIFNGISRLLLSLIQFSILASERQSSVQRGLSLAPSLWQGKQRGSIAIEYGDECGM